MSDAEAATVVHVGDLVMDRVGRARWAVMASFVGVEGGEPRCIEYRVRVVPTDGDTQGQFAGQVILTELQRDQERKRSHRWALAEVDAPAEGIPRYVFEQASQARLLEKARTLIKQQPAVLSPAGRDLLARQNRRRTGRPAVRPLGEKLRILAAIEATYESGGTLQDVADAHHMSRSSVRDLLAWARSGDSGVVLFTGAGPGRRGGQLTPEARAMLLESQE